MRFNSIQIRVRFRFPQQLSALLGGLTQCSSSFEIFSRPVILYCQVVEVLQRAEPPALGLASIDHMIFVIWLSSLRVNYLFNNNY